MRKTSNQYDFAKAPSADIQRSTFNRSFNHKTTIAEAGLLAPLFAEPVIPGDTVNISPTIFARLATPIYPIMDDIFIDMHFFFVPYRQL